MLGHAKTSHKLSIMSMPTLVHVMSDSADVANHGTYSLQLQATPSTVFRYTHCSSIMVYKGVPFPRQSCQLLTEIMRNSSM